jgi:hypothetical protein
MNQRSQRNVHVYLLYKVMVMQRTSPAKDDNDRKD